MPNASEFHLDGPSKFLPPGPLLCQMHVPRGAHCVFGSVTDRRDFYHQAEVSVERAQTNLLPFPYPLSNFEGSRANDEFCARQKVASEKRERVTQGDRFGLKSCLVDHHQGSVFPGFKSFFQGDHLGVEFALASHEQLLVDEGNDEGLLHPACRSLGHHPVPDGCRLEGLIIDDYFAIGVEPIGTRPEVSFAAAALTRAREAYEKHGLPGSPEKDVVSSRAFKAAGSEIVSSPESMRSMASSLSLLLVPSVLRCWF